MTGKTISHYKILEQLGQGGMGVVYKAQDIRLLRYVALKILTAELVGDEKRRSRFIREAQSASALNHPNICIIHDIDQADDVHFIVMELIEGETLRERLNRRGPLPETEVIDLALKVCDALAAVHEKGIFHRDIKPDNIMISRQGVVKVMDFGLATLAAEAAEAVAELELAQDFPTEAQIREKTYVENVVLTNLSGLLGTVHYMSPEQAQGKTVDHRSDIFSLGVALYELLTGKQPFAGKSNLTILSKIINDLPQPITLDLTQVSRELQQLIDRCIAKEPAQRFQNINEIIIDLRLLTQANLTVQEKRRVSKTSTIRPETYEGYLKGIFYFDYFTPMNLHKSIEFLKHAVKDDPNFVEAYVGLARALTHLGMTNWGPSAEAFAEARTMVMAALELEPENAEAMAILALIKFQTEYDWTGAGRLFKRAMARNPDSVIVSDSYAFYLTDTTQHEEAIRCARYCLNKVPQPCYYQLRLGWTYLVARQYDEAIAQFQETQLRFPELAFADHLLSWCYSMKGLHAQALSECAKGESKGMPPWQSSWIYARAGKTEEAKARLDAFRKQNLPDDWGVLFGAYAALGEIDLAFEELEKAYEKRLSHLVYLKAFPQFDVLRSDPRYFVLLKKIGLESDQPNQKKVDLFVSGASKPRSISAEAYDDYLKGTVYLENFTPVNLQKSCEHFRLAVDKDPNSAPARLKLAQTLAHLGFISMLSPQQAFPQARAEAHKALELDHTLVEAHAVLGMVKFLFEKDWSGAEAELRHVLEIDPDSVLANDIYAFYLTAMARHDESLARLLHTLAMEPRSFYLNLRLGWSYYVMRRYEEAIAQLQKTLELHPDLAPPHLFLAWCYVQKGMHAEALAECAKAHTKGLPVWQCGRVYAQSGKTEEARQGLEVLASQEIALYWMAEIYLGLGDFDRAFEQLEKAFEMRFPELAFLKVLPQFDDLRSEPRYFALLKKLGLENDQPKPGQTRTVKPEADEDYHKGAVYFDNFTPVNLQKSKEHFELAIASDPGFVQACVGLAQTLVHLGLTSLLPPKIAFPQAREVALKVLKLDQSLAEAHAVLGMIKFAFERDWAGAEVELKRANELSPKSILVNDAYAFYLTALEQHEGSLSRLEQNVATNPASFYQNLRLGWSYYMARQYDDAITQLQKTHELHRELSFPHIFLAWSYTRQGMHAEALAECNKAQIKGVPQWYFGRIYAEAGKIDEARKGLQVLLSENLPGYFFIADIYLALGNLDAAFAYFEKAYEENASEVTWLKVTPQFDAMRSDPRYFALLRKIGLASQDDLRFMTTKEPDSAPSPVGRAKTLRSLAWLPAKRRWPVGFAKRAYSAALVAVAALAILLITDRPFRSQMEKPPITPSVLPDQETIPEAISSEQGKVAEEKAPANLPMQARKVEEINALFVAKRIDSFAISQQDEKLANEARDLVIEKRVTARFAHAEKYARENFQKGLELEEKGNQARAGENYAPALQFYKEAASFFEQAKDSGNEMAEALKGIKNKLAAFKKEMTVAEAEEPERHGDEEAKAENFARALGDYQVAHGLYVSRVDFINAMGFILIKGGTFTMGYEDGHRDEQPHHEVRVNDFRISKFEVTNAQYAAFFNSAGHQTAALHHWIDLTQPGGQIEKAGAIPAGGAFRAKPGFENHPVVYVTWDGANAFCDWLGGRLPTEVEWEYACRAGSRSKYYFGDDAGKLPEHAWHEEQSGNKTHPVGTRRANAFGLHDMLGNVWEWCADWYDLRSYSGSEAGNPRGSLQGDRRVLRGGAFNSHIEQCRSSVRSALSPFDRYNSVGFRVVREAK